MFIDQSEAMSNMTVSEKLDKLGGQIMKLLDGQNQTNSKLGLLTKMMEAMKNFTGPGGFPPKDCYKCGMVCEMESGTVGVCQEDKSCSKEIPDCIIGGSDDCECGKPCKTSDGSIGLCQKDKTCSGMMDSIGGIASGMGGYPDCKPDGPHTGKPHTGKPHTGKPPTGKPPTDEKCDPMGPRDECMKVNFNTIDTDKDMCLKKGCCFFAPKRSTDPWCYFAKDGNGPRPTDPTDENEETTENVVTRPPPVHGAWGKWSAYSRCSRTCGGGIRSRRRACNSPAPMNGGRRCPGVSVQTGRCNTKACVSKPTAVCVDRYPPNLACKSTFSCPVLARKRACNKRFSQALPKWCSAKLNIRYRNQLIKNYCRKSCKVCRVG